jgi:GNAT superfamily N-acetyltransferase
MHALEGRNKSLVDYSVMKFMSSRIRQIVSSDRNGVSEISKHVWDGHDYLPLVFDEWMSDPQRCFCGLETEGKIVAVASLVLIEGGITGWMEGLRVHPDYRNRGFADALTEYIVEKGRELHVQRLRYTTSTENTGSLRIGEKNGFERSVEMAVLWLEDLKKAPYESSAQISESKPEEIYKLLQKNQTLIPKRVLIFDWKALDYNLSNLESLEAFRFFKELVKRKIHSLSLGSCKSGRWTFAIYSSDYDSFLSHLHHNINIALEDRAQLIVTTYLTDYEKNLLPVTLANDYWQTHLVLLERKLQ